MKPFLKTTLRLILLLLLFSFVNNSNAQFKLKDTIPLDPDLIVNKLPNGLTYYIRRNMKSRGNIQMRLVVNAGSVQEEADQLGLAHFMEHMNFGGLKHFPKKELINYLESIGMKFGADLNAYTSYDETVYMLNAAVWEEKKIDKLFNIMGDWAANATLDDAEIEKERSVVLEESRLYKNAATRVRKGYRGKLYNDCIYAHREPIGEDSIIRNFNPATLKKFYKTWYRPNLMSVIVVGDINTSYAEEEIKKYFEKLTNPVNEVPKPAINIPVRKQDDAVVVIDKELTTTYFELYNAAENAPKMVTWMDYRNMLIHQLFNTLISERMNEVTQQSNPPYIGSGAGFNTFHRKYKGFNAWITIGEKPVNTAINAMVTVLEQIKKYGFLPSELERAKTIVLSREKKRYDEMGKTYSSVFIDEYILHYLSEVPSIDISTRYRFTKEVMPDITLEQVNELSVNLNPTGGKLAVLVSTDQHKDIDTSSAALLALLHKASALPVAKYEEKKLDYALMDSLPIPGAIVEEKENTALGTTYMKFSNGVSVTLKPTTFKTDEIWMDGWRVGGAHNYGLQNKLSARHAARIVQAMGVKNLSNNDLNKVLAGKTVNVHPYINAYEEGIEGNCSVRNFDDFMKLVNLYFIQPRKDAGSFLTYLNKQKSESMNLLSNPQSFYNDSLTKLKYNNNPWANTLTTAAEYDQINLDTAFNIYKDIYSNAYGMHFTFVGNFNLEKIKPYLQTFLGSLPAIPKELKYTDEGMRPVKGIVNATIKKGQDNKSLVHVIFTGPAAFDEEEAFKLSFLTNIIEIELIEKLRQDLRGVYTANISSSFAKRPYENYTINATFPCGPENVEMLTKALFEIIENVRAEKIDKKHINKVRENSLGYNYGLLHYNNYWLSTLSHSWINNTDPEFVNKRGKLIESISARSLRELANKYFDMNNYIKVVMNPE